MSSGSSRPLLPDLAERRKPYLMAHRGDRTRCPENTLAAFARAIADGADILETDLHLSADGSFMCIHDASVDRTTDGRGEVREMTLAQLKALRASCGDPEFVDERIPTLEELAASLPPDVGLALELKTDEFLAPIVCERLLESLLRSGVRDRTITLSFSLARLQSLGAVDSTIPLGWITMSRLWPRREVQFLGPFWPLLFLNPIYAWLARRRGQMVCPLDPNPDRRLWYYRWLGCDAVLSDDPASTRKALDRG